MTANTHGLYHGSKDHTKTRAALGAFLSERRDRVVLPFGTNTVLTTTVHCERRTRVAGDLPQ